MAKNGRKKTRHALEDSKKRLTGKKTYVIFSVCSKPVHILTRNHHTYKYIFHL